jgi:1,4-dihydroxy-2-naphthoate polyprenyltransferase
LRPVRSGELYETGKTGVNHDLLKHWIQASRPPFFIATFIPLTAGWIMAGKLGAWRPLRMLLVLLGSFAVHLATNLANDYFDHVQGTDSGQSIGGSRVIQEGKISPEKIRRAVVILYLAAVLIALYFIIGLGLWILLPLTIFAWCSSYFYVAPPVRYGYHGLGELAVGINMGPIMVVGTYLVISGEVSWKPFLVSLPVGLMVAVILYFQSLPDMETDRRVFKHTLAVRLGKSRAFYGLILFWAAIYLLMIYLAAAGYLSLLAIASLLTIPLLIRLLTIMKKTLVWVELDRYGRYIRILYLVNGLIIIISLF